MNPILIKVFATALALSQVTTRPEAIKTHFDPVADRAEVVELVRAGCAHMRKVFDIEELNLDELIATAMDDPKALTGDIKAFRGINFADLHTAYREFCKNEKVDNSPVDLGEVVAFYNKAVADLPDHTRLKGLKLPGASVLLDQKGERFAELFEPDQRRITVPLSDIPEHVQKAFVAAEDKRFFTHKGIDERGLIRAFIGNLAQPMRPQGGSTITQQVAKNLVVGDDLTYERKIREMIVASRIERTLTKGEILALYLNSIYLGRGSWGIEMAARSYFGKPAKALTVTEGALLAGLTKGPNYFSPDRHPERAQERLAYVLNRMQEDGAISADEKQALGQPPPLVAIDRPHRDSGFYFADHVGREAKTLAGLESLTAASYTVRSTINPNLQRATEAALQDGLARYENESRRARFAGAEANLSEAIRRIATEPANAQGKSPTWLRALENARLPLYDVHWTTAVVIDKGRRGIRVGLADGRVLPLRVGSAIGRALKLYDVVFVRALDGTRRSGPIAELRVRPTVQGAALVIENKTGRILAMAGGFSYPLSQLNRTTQAQRQPGSAFKPLTYLAALKKGLQPNTLVRADSITLPPVGGGILAREQDYWSPRNADGRNYGVLTLRRALEGSNNLVTAHLLDGGIDSDPETSLDRVCELAMEAKLYGECVRHYPFVLGAQPVRLFDLAAFYAAIANEGARPSPYAIESIELGDKTVYRHAETALASIGSADRASFYQLKTILQGVLERGTARSIRQLAPYVAGKTGTTDGANDAWFVGFTNDVTVAVWVGYDNADGKRRTLGNSETGAKVAIPIFEPIIAASWAYHAPRTALNPPSPEAKRQLVDLPINLTTGDRLAANSSRAFVEHFRTDPSGEVGDTQYALVPREEVFAYREPGPYGGEGNWSWGGDYGPFFGPYSRAPVWREPQQRLPMWGGFFGERNYREYYDDRRRPRQIDPDYFWGSRRLY
jgi:penicillin-binding protein 1A